MESPAKARTRSDLREIWNSLFLDGLYSFHEDDEIQGIYLLMEGTLAKMKQLASSWSVIKSERDKISGELYLKNKECSSLKIQLDKLKTKCGKCSTLEKELSEVRRKSSEAQSRMKSIAKILRLGDSLEASESDRKNSAINLVSQMLLGNSPKRKKPCLENEILAPETVEVLPENPQTKNNAIVGESVPLLSPMKAIWSEFTSPDTKSSISPQKTPKACSSFPLMTTPKRSAKKNLSADFHPGNVNIEDDEIIDESPKKPLSFNIAPPLNESLFEYVKESHSHLEKIWFDPTGIKTPEPDPSEAEITVIAETPVNRRPINKSESSWALKEKNGVSKEKSSRGNRLKQLKLSLKPTKETELDVSKYNQDEEEIIANSPNEPKSSKLNLNTQSSQDLNSTLFKPIASSTQKPSSSFDSPIQNNPSSPDYVYQRDAVRSKAERKKLQGWDCEECQKYYTALGNQISPSKIKERMNACSRHRNKFKPVVHGTPPEFWNPLFPDSQFCKERGFYESVLAPKSD